MSNSVEYFIDLMQECKEAKEAKESLGNKGHATKKNSIHGISEDFKIIKSKKIMTSSIAYKTAKAIVDDSKAKRVEEESKGIYSGYWYSPDITDEQRESCILIKKQQILVELTHWKSWYANFGGQWDESNDKFYKVFENCINKTISKSEFNKLSKELSILYEWMGEVNEQNATRILMEYGLTAFLKVWKTTRDYKHILDIEELYRATKYHY